MASLTASCGHAYIFQDQVYTNTTILFLIPPSLPPSVGEALTCTEGNAMGDLWGRSGGELRGLEFGCSRSFVPTFIMAQSAAHSQGLVQAEGREEERYHPHRTAKQLPLD